MSDPETPQNVIESYRKRQKSARRAPLLFILSALLLVGGAVLLIFWGIPAISGSSLFATDTPTATNTSTATLTATFTNTPTITLTETATPTITLTPTISGPFIYTVVEGDNCWTIAVNFKVDLLVLLTVNNLDPTCPIQAGDKLIIPGVETSLPTSTPIPANLPRGTKIEYIVQTGDMIGAIALRFNSTVDAIVKENNIENPNELLVGTKLIVPVNLVTPVPTNTIAPTVTGTPPTATVALPEVTATSQTVTTTP